MLRSGASYLPIYLPMVKCTILFSHSNCCRFQYHLLMKNLLHLITEEVDVQTIDPKPHPLLVSFFHRRLGQCCCCCYCCCWIFLAGQCATMTTGTGRIFRSDGIDDRSRSRSSRSDKVEEQRNKNRRGEFHDERIVFDLYYNIIML